MTLKEKATAAALGIGSNCKDCSWDHGGGGACTTCIADAIEKVAIQFGCDVAYHYAGTKTQGLTAAQRMALAIAPAERGEP